MLVCAAKRKDPKAMRRLGVQSVEQTFCSQAARMPNGSGRACLRSWLCCGDANALMDMAYASQPRKSLKHRLWGDADTCAVFGSRAVTSMHQVYHMHKLEFSHRNVQYTRETEENPHAAEVVWKE